MANLNSLSPDQVKEWFQGFADRSSDFPRTLERDRLGKLAGPVCRATVRASLGHPSVGCFSEGGNRICRPLEAAAPPEPPPVPRLGIAVIGQGVPRTMSPYFETAAHGAYFSQVKPENGLQTLLSRSRCSGQGASGSRTATGTLTAAGSGPRPALTCVSYQAWSPRGPALAQDAGEIEKPGMGPEALSTLLAQMRPAELGIASGQGRFRKTRNGARSFSGEASDGRIRNADFQHNLRAMDGARDAAPGPAAYSAGPLCSAAAAEADERVAVRKSNQRRP